MRWPTKLLFIYIYLHSTATGTLTTNEFLTVVLNNGNIFLWGADDDVEFTGLNLTDGMWHSVAITYDGAGQASLYADGVFSQTLSYFNTGFERTINYNTIGDNNWLGVVDGYDHPYTGNLQNIAFYSYALTAAEAAVIYTSSPSITPSSPPSTIVPTIEPTAAPTTVEPSIDFSEDSSTIDLSTEPSDAVYNLSE